MKILPALPPSPSKAECRQFVKDIARSIGPGFHPDTPFDEYVKLNGSAVIRTLFDDETAARLQRDFDTVCDKLQENGIDPCKIAAPIQRQQLLQRIGKVN